MNLGMLFYNPLMPGEKYNAPDTLKCQHTFKLTAGHCLYSDMGRIFCSVIEDNFEQHETVCGNSHASHIKEQWGARDYQTQSNDWHQNGYDSFLVELAKYGLGKRDMASNINWFSGLSCDKDGSFELLHRSEPGSRIVLRFEMDTLVVMHTCPHPLNTQADYPRGEIELLIGKADAVQEDDFCMNACDENKRGFQNNALFHMGGE